MDKLSENKAQLANAHRSQNWELAKLLSQERETLKKEARRFKKCVVCGVTCSGEKCLMHRNYPINRLKSDGKPSIVSLEKTAKYIAEKLRREKLTEERLSAIIVMVSQSYDLIDIAKTLGIARNSVYYYMRCLKIKLELKNANDLAGITRYAISKGLISI